METDLNSLHLEIASPDTVELPSNPVSNDSPPGQRVKNCRRCSKEFSPRPRQQLCDSCRGTTSTGSKRSTAPKSPAAARATAETLAKLLTGATVLYAMWLTQPFPTIEDTTEYELEDAEAAAIATPLARALTAAAPKIAQRITGSEDIMLAVFASVSYVQRVYPMHKQRLDATRKTPKPRQQERTSREDNINGHAPVRQNNTGDVIRYGLNTWQLDT